MVVQKKINNKKVNNNNNNKKNKKNEKEIIVEDKSDGGVLNKVDNFMNKVYDTPEVFVGSTDKIKSSMTDIMSNLYELAKKNESTITETDGLDELVTKGFDGEQIWAQIQLYNDPILKELESKVDDFAKSNESLELVEQDGDEEEYDEDQDDFDLGEDDYQESDLDGEDEENQDDEDEDDLDEEDEDELSPQEDESLGDSDIDSEEDNNKNKKKPLAKNTTVKNNNKDNNKKSNNNSNNKFFGDENVDFFNAKEMEKFLDDEDDNEYQRREDEEEDEDELEGDSAEEDGGLDLPEVDEMSDEERQLDELLDKYVEQNADELEEQRRQSTKKANKKSVDPSNMKFDDFFADPNQDNGDDDDDDDDEFSMDGHSDDYQEDDQDDYQDDEEPLSGEEDDEGESDQEEKEEEKEEATLPPEELSSFQKRAQRIQQRIKELEQQNLKKKDWTLIGETSAKERPTDSLLGEVLDFDHTQRVTPTITEETNKTIEDIIKKRILEKNFDDVIRKTEKEFKDNYKKKVELSDEKSTEGLGDVYEKSYMKQVLGVEETDQLKAKHIKIYEYFNKLCYKLDSLTNFQYTPKRIKNKELNITTANALTMEEKIPVATSTATMIAPEEVYFKKNADEKGESELTKEERAKNRKKIKQQWKDEKEQAESEIRHKKKVDPTFAQKSTVAASLAHLTQSKNVTIVDTKKSETRSGDFRSAQTFSKIQNMEDNKRKGIEDPNSNKSKKKAKLDKLQVSSFKL